MNRSERVEFDEKFPSHPLSEGRALAKYIIENNGYCRHIMAFETYGRQEALVESTGSFIVMRCHYGGKVEAEGRSKSIFSGSIVAGYEVGENHITANVGIDKVERAFRLVAFTQSVRHRSARFFRTFSTGFA